MCNRYWLWLLSLGLVGSLVINGLLGLWAYDYYLELNQTRLDPVGVTAYTSPTISTRKEEDTLRIVFYGDSRAYNWPAPTDLPTVEFINRGIGGQTTAQIFARYDAHVVPLQPDLVIIQAGINDLKTIGLFPEQRDLIVESCKKNLAAMVQRTTEQGATVLLTTIFPTAQPSPVRRPFWSEDVDLAVTEVNQYLATLTNDRVVLFDSAALLRGADGKIEPEYSHDLLHLNAAGYAILNQQLKSALLKLM